MEQWLTSETIIKAGEIVVALSALSLCLVIFKGYNRTMNNHLHDAHLDKVKDIESRERNTVILTKLAEKIDNLK